MLLEVVHCIQPCSDTEVFKLPSLPLKSPTDMQSTSCPRLGGMESQREHLLAGIWHLATHSPEILEAIPDGVDVGHSHKHNLTVRVVLCRQEKTATQDKSSPSGQSFPDRTDTPGWQHRTQIALSPLK